MDAQKFVPQELEGTENGSGYLDEDKDTRALLDSLGTCLHLCIPTV